jgi:hypothetical protein
LFILAKHRKGETVHPLPSPHAAPHRAGRRAEAAILEHIASVADEGKGKKGEG